MARHRFRRGALLIWRALRRRCPNCGGRGIFSSWFKMEARCRSCGLALERGEHGYVVGAYMFNIAAAELGFVVLFMSVVFLTWPHPPWTLLTYASMGLVVVLPIAFYPFSKTLFLGIHLLFQPEESPTVP